MIISRKYRYVFVHVRKTAGSSVKVALASYLGAQDVMAGSWHEVVTRGGEINEATHGILNSWPGRCDFALQRLLGRPRAVAVNEVVRTHFRRRGLSNPPHATAQEITEHFPETQDGYSWFAVMRDPMARLYSE